MSLLILLDSGPLGLVTNPKANAETTACQTWLNDVLRSGRDILVPAITDYEVRRELLLYNKINGLSNLDALKAIGYLPLTPEALLRALTSGQRCVRRGCPRQIDSP